ncbi:uncharacterized protein MELLADRAFT_113133 [Melampsora larici-populina 98AG31]|uniref:No apical meristem-associated C-terminal domain-containing protein n=1 Tax=Melampsora larici-populina (strain 98AG31 / pathotype 3-4-7) TaxID=747676 RepID=F4S8V6_MELLP|nr:uncharacterized protein MELLADRAFT_113133 [Melampsora larici-populina 98AG31]EGF98921.1 hypothetical protein MELLADRAFT_113133 [Melampsora larici-populina 98AG31]
MSVPTNHAKLMGSGPKTQVGGLSRGAEWNALAAMVNIRHNDRLRVTNTSSPANALKQSNSERLSFYKEQINLASIKQDERAQIASTAAADALTFEKEKWKTQQVREDAKSASEAAQLFQISQATRDHEDKKAQREAIERCRKEQTPMEEIKEYINFLFPPSDNA